VVIAQQLGFEDLPALKKERKKEVCTLLTQIQKYSGMEAEENLLI